MKIRKPLFISDQNKVRHIGVSSPSLPIKLIVPILMLEVNSHNLFGFPTFTIEIHYYEAVNSKLMVLLDTRSVMKEAIMGRDL